MESQFGVMISESEPLFSGAMKLVNECDNNLIQAGVVSIEDIKRGIVDLGSLPLCLYPLSNSDYLSTLIPLLMRRNHQIINAIYYQQRFDKISMQICLRSIGIRVPEFYPMNRISKIKSLMDAGIQILAKPNGHLGRQEIISRGDNLTRFQDSITIRGEYYAERFIHAEAEYKLYVVGEKVFFNNSKLDMRTHEIVQLAKGISMVSKLEVFSADVLEEINTHHLFVIDVNPASAFYLHAIARTEFIQYIKNQIITTHP